MHYVYVLVSKKDKDFYAGCTHDLKERLRLHNAGKVSSTKKRRPFVLIYYEGYLHPKDAFAREKYFKTQWGKTHLRKALRNTLHSQKF
jgi:putative endonuclease